MQMGAEFDATGQYRYTLWREWDGSQPRVGFVMLNPSTADATADDPTIRRCMGFARRWGCGSVEVVNLFAYRATRPQLLQQAIEPVGLDNDRQILAASRRVSWLVLAWGNFGSWLGRDRAVVALLNSVNCYCLGLNRTGSPKHPLYLPNRTQLISFHSLL